MNSESMTPSQSPKISKLLTNISFFNNNSDDNTRNKNVINDINDTSFSFTKVDYNQNLKKKSKSFEENLSNYIVNAKKNMDSKRHLWQNTITSNKGEITKLQEEIKLFEKIHKEFIKYESSKNEGIIVLKKRIEKVEGDIKQQREVIEVKRALLETQLSQNLPELSIFTNKLALTMDRVQDDMINFTFTCIYDNNSSRSCCFTIDVGKTKYKVIECNPMLEELDELVSQLNTSRDFFSFLKKMRQGFRKYAKADT
ncbi:kinetochore protein Spc25 [Gigaspora margarita]|uniref:Kinetochore protein SPC25 n=1 Tax=Gigaspora margarita TaxID=4874 RepID=A0A8H3XEN7_GIGMA|nr:kinetochore protein Spc25 [Gigaspora margarita]